MPNISETSNQHISAINGLIYGLSTSFSSASHSFKTLSSETISQVKSFPALIRWLGVRIHFL